MFKFSGLTEFSGCEFNVMRSAWSMMIKKSISRF